MPKGTLVIVVLRCRNLKNLQKVGKQSPYVTLTHRLHRKRTSVIHRGGQSPEYDEEFRFNIPENLDEPWSIDAVVDRRGGVQSRASADSVKSTSVGRDVRRGSVPSSSASVAATSTSASPATSKGTTATGRHVHVAVYADDAREPELVGEGLLDISNVLTKGEADGWVELTRKDLYAGEVYVECTFYSSEPPPPPPKEPSPPPVVAMHEDDEATTDAQFYDRDLAEPDPLSDYPDPDLNPSHAAFVAAQAPLPAPLYADNGEAHYSNGASHENGNAYDSPGSALAPSPSFDAGLHTSRGPLPTPPVQQVSRPLPTPPVHAAPAPPPPPPPISYGTYAGPTYTAPPFAASPVPWPSMPPGYIAPPPPMPPSSSSRPASVVYPPYAASPSPAPFMMQPPPPPPSLPPGMMPSNPMGVTQPPYAAWPSPMPMSGPPPPPPPRPTSQYASY